VNHLAMNWVVWILLLFALFWLQGCATAPTVLTEVEIRDVPVPVRTPLPTDCFEQHSVSQSARMSAEGSLTFKEYVTWVDGLIVITKRYQVQARRCANLNEEPGRAVPIEES